MTASMLKQDPNTKKFKRMLIYFDMDTVFYGLTKGISPKICLLCVHVKISKRLFEPFCVWILFVGKKNIVNVITKKYTNYYYNVSDVICFDR